MALAQQQRAAAARVARVMKARRRLRGAERAGVMPGATRAMRARRASLLCRRAITRRDIAAFCFARRDVRVHADAAAPILRAPPPRAAALCQIAAAFARASAMPRAMLARPRHFRLPPLIFSFMPLFATLLTPLRCRRCRCRR